MPEPTTQDHKRAQEKVGQCFKGGDCKGPKSPWACCRKEHAIATALAEQRERYDALMDAAAMVEPLRHIVNDEECGYSPGTRLPSERLKDLAEAVEDLRRGDD